MCEIMLEMKKTPFDIGKMISLFLLSLSPLKWYVSLKLGYLYKPATILNTKVDKVNEYLQYWIIV